ncbi:oxidoreductase [Arthrobacter sp. R3-55]
MKRSRVALVTGASTGIGFDTAIALRDAGFTVYAGARRLEKMEPLKGHGITVLSLDVTSEESMATAVALVEEAHGHLDVLVNNAGYGSYGSLEEVPLAEGRRQLEVNVMGLARMTQLVIPGMRRVRSGRIINVTSIGGKIYEPLGSWYHASKFAVEGMSDSLRLELTPHGIDVVIVEPSGTNSEWGTIAGEGLLATSGDGPYQQQAHVVAAALASTSGEGHVLSTPARVVANVIVRAATAKRPRTRYPVGRGAWSVLALRKFLPDRAFDVVFWNLYRRLAG